MVDKLPTIMFITPTVQVEGDRKTPVNPFLFGKAVQYDQDTSLKGRHKILFNKGRYFETSIYTKDVLEKVSELTGIPIQYNNMIVGNWNRMEDFVAAMNLLGYYVEIEIDWI